MSAFAPRRTLVSRSRTRAWRPGCAPEAQTPSFRCQPPGCEIRMAAACAHRSETLRAHIAREQPASAERVAGRILAAAERLVYPDLGRMGRAPDTRELAVART